MEPNEIKCPVCGAPMMLRFSKRYPNPDGSPRKFYGCSRWPACHGIRNITQEAKIIPAPIVSKPSPFPADALDRMADKLRTFHFSRSAAKGYLATAQRFVSFCSTKGLGFTDQQYVEGFLDLLERFDYAASTTNLSYAGIRFFFNRVLERPIDLKKIPYVNQPTTVPKVLSREQVGRLVNWPQNAQHRLMLKTCYGHGLRVSELTGLKVEDISLDRNSIKVVHGKGEKERHIPLLPGLKEAITEQIRGKGPKDYVFPNQLVGGRLSVKSVQNVFKRAKDALGIPGDFGVHVLRHSFITHLLEAGKTTKQAQLLAGHANEKTTAVYSHVSMAALQGVTDSLGDVVNWR